MKYNIEYAKKLFTHSLATPEQIEWNSKAWLKSVETLGSKWLLAKKVERKEKK